MSLTKRQQNWILKNRKLGAEKISEKINVDLNDVEKLLKENQAKSAPKFFYLILILIPLLFIVLLETGLRIFDYGEEYNVWLEVTDERKALNPRIGRKYFSAVDVIPQSIQDVFYSEKPDSSFRIFVLGGSSAAGYPFMPLGSFSRYLQQRLEHVYPDYKIEVVNLSLTAINTYTIRDLMPSVLEENPDLIIIYSGHNEYYGALGVGSMESLGGSTSIVNLLLYLKQFRTTQLVANILGWTADLFSDKKETPRSTLMARMAEEKSIPLHSELYTAGIEQFKENISNVIEMIRGNNVPLIIGTLTSNIKDQKPFISRRIDSLPAAGEVYENGNRELRSGNIKKADSLFHYAKDLDLLRFRAPEKINEVIRELSRNYKFTVVDIDSAFKTNSPEKIVGNNLMTDHVHPTLNGFHLMGKLFYETMAEKNYLPRSKPLIHDLNIQDSLTVANFYFSKLDSTVAFYRIKYLKNDWPFIDKENEIKNDRLLLNPQNKIDSLAFDIIINDLPYIDALGILANYYLGNNDLDNYAEYMKIIINQYPLVHKFYRKAAEDLIAGRRYEDAIYFVEKLHKETPDEFTKKWLGINYFSQGDHKKAINYLTQSLESNPNDQLVLLNLASAYYKVSEYKLALTLLDRLLELNPGLEAAEKLKASVIGDLEN